MMRTEWQKNNILIPGALLKPILSSPSPDLSNCPTLLPFPFIVIPRTLCNLSSQNLLSYCNHILLFTDVRAKQVIQFCLHFCVIASEGPDLS